MTVYTIAEILEAIETRLATIDTLRVSAIHPDQINVPSGGGVAIVGVPPIDYRLTMGRAKYTLEPTVTVLVSAALDRVGQLQLAGYANPTGSTSVVAAFDGDVGGTERTLGGVVADCIVVDFKPLGLLDIGQVSYYAGQFTLRVIALGA